MVYNSMAPINHANLFFKVQFNLNLRSMEKH